MTRSPLYEAEQAGQSTLEWQRHIIRGAQQEAGKKVLLDMVNSNSLLVKGLGNGNSSREV